MEDKIDLGEPLDQSDEELERLAAVTKSDLNQADVMWRKYAPAPLRTMLDAERSDAQGK